MSAADELMGERFSLACLDRGPATPDSKRLRTRLSGYFNDSAGQIGPHLVSAVKTELGVEVPMMAMGYDWDRFLTQCEIRDLLDFITLVWRYFTGMRLRQSAAEWLAFVRRAITEENLSYRVDDQGGVRFAVDSEFARGQAAVIGLLNDARYAAVRHSVEECNKALDQTTPDTLKAVRSIYDAQETLFKQTFTQAKLIGSGEIEKFVVAKLQSLYVGRELEATKLYVSSWKKWVDAMQQYRHADGAQEPNPPPNDLAIAVTSAGMGHLRWFLAVADKLRGAA